MPHFCHEGLRSLQCHEAVLWFLPSLSGIVPAVLVRFVRFAAVFARGLPASRVGCVPGRRGVRGHYVVFGGDEKRLDRVSDKTAR